MKAKITLSLVLLSAFALSANALVSFFAGDFAFADPDGSDQLSEYTDGVSPTGVISLWGLLSSVQPTGGNPGEWLSMANWNSLFWVATPVSPLGETVTFSVDYRNEGNPWGSQFDVIGVPTGGTVTGLGEIYSNATGGTTLLDSSLANTNGLWVTKTEDVVIPAGFSSVIFRVGQDHNQSALRGFDNISITAVPEPSTYAAILGAIFLGMAVIRSRRRIAGSK